MRFVELFAGIGGFSLGFERAGMECVGHVEIEPYAQKVLLKHWPDVPLLPDVTKVKGDEFGQVDVLCGGFPCQDISVAGNQKGLIDENGESTRSGLYDEIIRIARICRPKYIVLENVAALLSRAEWFGYVLGRLAEIGYDAEWQIIRASDVGAPHKRARVWIVAYPNTDHSTDGTEQRQQLQRTKEPARSSQDELETGGHVAHPRRKPEGCEKKPERTSDNTSRCCSWEDSRSKKAGGKNNVADTDKERLQGFRANGDKERWQEQNERQAGLCRGARPERDSIWEAEPNVGRVANGVPSRTHRLKCLGNALIPQIAEFIGNQIILTETKKTIKELAPRS